MTPPVKSKVKTKAAVHPGPLPFPDNLIYNPSNNIVHLFGNFLFLILIETLPMSVFQIHV